MRSLRFSAILAVLWISFEVFLRVFICGHGCRQAAAEHVLMQVEVGIEQYEKSWGAYPPGDGSGWPELRRGLLCGFFPAEDVAAPDAWDLRYRRHPPGTTPPYDLWIVDGEGVEFRRWGQP